MTTNSSFFVVKNLRPSLSVMGWAWYRLELKGVQGSAAGAVVVLPLEVSAATATEVLETMERAGIAGSGECTLGSYFTGHYRASDGGSHYIFSSASSSIGVNSSRTRRVLELAEKIADAVGADCALALYRDHPDFHVLMRGRLP
jgi:hypothetical protein